MDSEEQIQEQRRQAVRKARADKHTLGEIAEAIGTSPSNLGLLLKRGGKHSPFLEPLDRWLNGMGYLTLRRFDAFDSGKFHALIRPFSAEDCAARSKSLEVHRTRLKEAGVEMAPYLLMPTDRSEWDEDGPATLEPETEQVAAICKWLSAVITADPAWLGEWEAEELAAASQALIRAERAIRKANKARPRHASGAGKSRRKE